MSKMLFNDAIVERSNVIDIEDRGYQFGDGIYEVIGIYQGKMFMCDEHLERLQRSAKELQLSIPYSIDKLKRYLIELVNESNLKEGVVYLQITRGIAERWHHFPENTRPIVIAYTKKEETMTEFEDHGAKAILTEDIRWLRCDIKTLNLLPNVLAKQKAVEYGAVEAIMHRNNIVTEASASNVFIVKNGEVFTHPANNFILNGITRRKVLQICQTLGINAKEEVFTVNDLLNADEVIVTATKSDIIPIIQVDQLMIGDGKPGEIAKRIVERFRQSIHDVVKN